MHDYLFRVQNGYVTSCAQYLLRIKEAYFYTTQTNVYYITPQRWYTVFRGYFIRKQNVNDRYAVRSNVMF